MLNHSFNPDVASVQNTAVSGMSNAINIDFRFFKTYDLDGKPDEWLKIFQTGYVKTKDKDRSLLDTL